MVRGWNAKKTPLEAQAYETFLRLMMDQKNWNPLFQTESLYKKTKLSKTKPKPNQTTTAPPPQKKPQQKTEQVRAIYHWGRDSSMEKDPVFGSNAGTSKKVSEEQEYREKFLLTRSY